MKRALVFGGGGAKGAYELGVWHAIRELGIKIDIVTGSSVGALNGAMFAVDNYELAEKLWLNLTPNQIIKTNETDPKVVYQKFLKEAATGGADTSPLEELLQMAVDEKKTRASNIKYGLITCNFPSLKPVFITLDEMKEGSFVDYLMASATAYPTFRPKVIDGSRYIDGGFYDNLPVNMAIDMGADEVIAVDLKAIGIYRKLKNKNIDVHTIIPSRGLGSFLMFDKDLVKINAAIGYQDTLKYFSKLDGEYYSFKKDEIEVKGKELAIVLRRLISKIFDSDQDKLLGFAQLFTARKVLKKFESKHQRSYSNSISKLIQGIDCAGKTFGLDDLHIYTLEEFNHKLIEQVNQVFAENPEYDKADITLDVIGIDKLYHNNPQFFSCYILRKINRFEKGEIPSFDIYTIFTLYPTYALSALYIEAVFKCMENCDEH